MAKTTLLLVLLAAQAAADHDKSATARGFAELKLEAAGDPEAAATVVTITSDSPLAAVRAPNNHVGYLDPRARLSTEVAPGVHAMQILVKHGEDDVYFVASLIEDGDFAVSVDDGAKIDLHDITADESRLAIEPDAGPAASPDETIGSSDVAESLSFVTAKAGLRRLLQRIRGRTPLAVVAGDAPAAVVALAPKRSGAAAALVTIDGRTGATRRDDVDPRCQVVTRSGSGEIEEALEVRLPIPGTIAAMRVWLEPSADGKLVARRASLAIDRGHADLETTPDDGWPIAPATVVARCIHPAN